MLKFKVSYKYTDKQKLRIRNIYKITDIVDYRQIIYLDISIYGCNYNQIPLPLEFSQISELELISNLKILKLCGQIALLPNIPSNITILDCSCNNLRSLPELPSKLVYLNLSKNLQLTCLPVLPPTLVNLNCAYNQITCLPILPPTLVNLNCEYNKITCLPILPSGIIQLMCSNNHLSSLPDLPKTIIEISTKNNINIATCDRYCEDFIKEILYIIPWTKSKTYFINSIMDKFQIKCIKCGKSLIRTEMYIFYSIHEREYRKLYNDPLNVSYRIKTKKCESCR